MRKTLTFAKCVGLIFLLIIFPLMLTLKTCNATSAALETFATIDNENERSSETQQQEMTTVEKQDASEFLKIKIPLKIRILLILLSLFIEFLPILGSIVVPAVIDVLHHK